jgi:hypothetical protein
VLFTRVAYWPAEAMRTTGGSAVEVSTLAEVTTGGRSLAGGLADLAADRDIEVQTATSLRRIVFGEDGEIEGVVLDTRDGELAVRARLGIAICPPRAELDDRPLEPGSLIALVGQRASRFGRIEVLKQVPAPAGS